MPVAALFEGVWNFVSSSRPWLSRGLHDRISSRALKLHDAIHPAALDRPLALQLESELDEKLSRGREVVNDDAHVVHPLDRHVLDGKDATLEPCLSSV